MKRFTFKQIPAVVSLTSAALLVACGGGGGGSSAQVNTSALTSSNAQAVTAQALNGSSAINGGATNGNSLASSVVTGVSVTGTAAVRTGLVNAALQQLYLGLDVAQASNLPTGVTTTLNPSPCSGGGTISGTLTQAVPKAVSNGDSVTITTNNCGLNGEKLNGTFTLSFSGVSGVIGQSSIWGATMALRFTNFTVEENNEVVGSNGDMTLAFSQNGYQDVEYSVSGSSLRATLAKSGVTVLDQTLSGFSYKGTSNSTGVTQTADFTFTDNLAASYTAYTVKTIKLFKQTSASSYPYEGSLTVTAGNNSKATLTAIDSTNVRIDLDKNGDGTTDETISTTWATLN